MVMVHLQNMPRRSSGLGPFGLIRCPVLRRNRVGLTPQLTIGDYALPNEAQLSWTLCPVGRFEYPDELCV
jgi:hypothetical protein